MYNHKINFINGQSIEVFTDSHFLPNLEIWAVVNKKNKIVHIPTRNVLYAECLEDGWTFDSVHNKMYK